MKKLIFFLLLFLSAAPIVSAQDYNNVRRFEFEIGAGIAKGFEQSIGFNTLLEGRINIKRSPFDAGLQSSGGFFFGDGNNNEPDNHSAEFFYAHSFMIYGDYNYRMKGVTVFGGLGAGYYVNSLMYYGDSFVFGPRIGVKLLNRLRFALDYKLIKKDLSYGSINIGIVFGGGHKR